jgi:broad specificity phosphatase PhoE
VSASPLDLAFLTGIEDVTEIVLVRHGQQDVDPATARRADWIDPPLSATGRRQAEVVAEHLRGRRPDAVYTSGLQRALDTGRAIAAHHRIEPIVDEQLAEIGTFSELPRDKELSDLLDEAELQAVRERFVRERRWDVYPYSEASADFRRRVLRSLDRIAADHPGGYVVVACHGGVINVLVAEVAASSTDMIFRPAHASTHWFRHRHETWAIDRLNEIHHLQAAGVLTV